jgi:hypothetical protein
MYYIYLINIFKSVIFCLYPYVNGYVKFFNFSLILFSRFVKFVKFTDKFDYELLITLYT